MNYFYCDTCFLITAFQEGKLESLSKYKDRFYISKIHLDAEILRPPNLKEEVLKAVTVIAHRKEIIEKAIELYNRHQALSEFDGICLAFAILDGYCLITNDKNIIKCCHTYKVATKTFEDILFEFKL